MSIAAPILFIFLIISVVLVAFRRGKMGKFAVYFRLFTVLCALAYFVYAFYTKSSENLVKDAVSVQVINSLPQPLDFYIINRVGDKVLNVNHLENIRPDYYRAFYDTVRTPHQMWVAGFLGKKNIVYFSEIPVNNLSEDKIIKVENYAIQNEKNSETAAEDIANFKMQGVTRGVYTTLTFLLIFINIFLLIRNWRNHSV